MLCNIIHSSKKKKKKKEIKENEREHITVQNAFLVGPIQSDCIQTCSLDELSLIYVVQEQCIAWRTLELLHH
jgi:hypothetical protein